jgi:hypothetical protein
MPEYQDFPIAELIPVTDKLIGAGCTVFFKWTCGGCGARQTFDTPNVLYTRGKCEECDHVTDLRESGCNYLLVA